MVIDIRQAFDAIGAELAVSRDGRIFEIDVRQADQRELYQLTYPRFQAIETTAIDVKPALRHLVLDVAGRWRFPGARFLCGHDERHWFVASLPIELRTATVRGAMESLKPNVVLREQKRLGVKHRRHRRQTAAYIRQGEWFFLPRPMMHVGELAVRGGQLARENGKPHQVEWIHQPEGRDETFVRGAVSHPDHETIRLQVWHRVVQNTEIRPAPIEDSVARMAYLD